MKSKRTITLEDLYDGQQLLIRLVNGLDDRLAGLESRFDGLENELSELRTYVEAGFDTMNDRFDRIESRMDGYEGRGGLLRLAVS